MFRFVDTLKAMRNIHHAPAKEPTDYRRHGAASQLLLIYSPNVNAGSIFAARYPRQISICIISATRHNIICIFFSLN